MTTLRSQAALMLSMSGLVSGAWAGDGAPAPEAADWRAAEAPILADHVQLTFPADFRKAGEQYFSPDGKWLIFQATAASDPPEAAYSMFVAPVLRTGEGESERITGLGRAVQLSAPGSANTCGFFHPKDHTRVIFGSTIVRPAAEAAGGYQRGTNRYRWSFPDEMEIVEVTVPAIWDSIHSPDGKMSVSAKPPVPVFTRRGYDAECAYSPDGRFIVHASVDPETLDADLFVFDTTTKKRTPLVQAKGYDGGPFFSPDGKSICYRSDRAGNDLLQVFIADLVFGEGGAITGTTNERHVTDNEHVNWGPFWHPSGTFLVYATSEVGHSNYEVFAVEAPVGARAAAKPDELLKKRLTYAAGFDGLPAFSADGRFLVWTSQRGPKAPGEEKPSSQIWAARVSGMGQ